MPTHASVAAGPRLVVPLGGARLDDPDLGGKAASLNRLARRGYMIPPGFCVTAAAYRCWLDSVTDREALADAIGRLPDVDARTEIDACLAATPVPAAVADAIQAGLTSLASGPEAAPLAVRSSALDEDGAAASFAGVHETELGCTADGVAAAIQRCWLSLWSSTAVAYRARRNLRFDGVAMAVVVQRLVAADVSAVVFTRHPVTGRDDVLINAIRGLGEPMVSGEATPETIVVDRDRLAITERIGGDTGERLFVRGGRVVRERDGADDAGEAVLTDAVALELAELALDVEARFGVPIDIEAARTEDRWILLQARPITTHQSR
jgi:rifampicin phosphotransferase